MVHAAGHRFGTIVWETHAGMDEAIQFVATCDDLDWAIQLAESVCSSGEQWAVVDLETMGVAARGEHEDDARSRHPAAQASLASALHRHSRFYRR